MPDVAPGLITPNVSLLRGQGRIPSIVAEDNDPASYVKHLVGVRSHFELMYRNSGGLVAGARIETFLARQTLSVMNTMATNVGATEQLRRRSQRAVGGLVALAGVCAYDSEDWGTANSHFQHALAIAEVSRDHSFRAYTIALMVNQALALEDYKMAEALASAGLQSSTKASATALTIDLQVMRAKALAALGDSSAAMSAIRELESAVIVADDDVAEANYVQEGQLQAQLAEALTSLGDLTAARRFAEQSILGSSHPKGRVNRLASMVTLEIARGEIDQASSFVREMIDSTRGMESRRLQSRFATIRAALAGRPTIASREAMDRLDMALMLMS